jgi:DNA-binding response OmpR family regulator
MTTTHRVLVAEEDETCRAFLVENLTADGYAVDVAASRQDAICSLRHDSPDLVLVDVDVNASTLALVDWIRAGDDTLGARATDTPIVVAGSHTSEIDRVRLLDRGADDVVSKPYSYPELRARIVAVLRCGRRVKTRPAAPLEN